MPRRKLTSNPYFIHPKQKNRWKEAKRGTWTTTSMQRRLDPQLQHRTETEQTVIPETPPPPQQASTPEELPTTDTIPTTNESAENDTIDYTQDGNLPDDSVDEPDDGAYTAGEKDLAAYFMNSYIPALKQLNDIFNQLFSDIYPVFEEAPEAVKRHVLASHNDGRDNGGGGGGSPSPV